MSLINFKLKAFLSILLLVYTVSFLYAQDSCISLNPIRKLISQTIPANIDSIKVYDSEYYIVDIKLNNQNDSICRIDFYHRCESGKAIKYMQKLLCELKKYSWKNTCSINRVLIPIFLLPLADKSRVFDMPFDLKIGIKRFGENNSNTQLTLETIVITLHKSIR